MEKYFVRGQYILHMPLCVHLPFRISTYPIGVVFFVVAQIFSCQVTI